MWRLVRCICLVVFLTGFAAVTAAEDGRFGLGIQVGNPTGITGKHHFRGRPVFIDWAFGFSLFEGRGLNTHLDFLWQPRLMTFDRARMDLYFGVGPQLWAQNDNVNLGVRAPLGVDFILDRVPIDVFVEVAAGLWIVEGADFNVDAAAGFRWWF
jgi:hypothetical protein